MSKFDEKEIRRKLEIISHIAPTSQSTGRALEKVRQVLISKEEKVSNAVLWGKFRKSRITRLTAAAAIIIMAIGLFVVHHRPVKRIEPPEVLEVTKSPAELTTFASLSLAYRRGGIELVEEMCDRALTLAGPRPAEISVQDLFEEFNGKNLERKRL